MHLLGSFGLVREEPANEVVLAVEDAFYDRISAAEAELYEHLPTREGRAALQRLEHLWVQRSAARAQAIATVTGAAAKAAFSMCGSNACPHLVTLARHIPK